MDQTFEVYQVESDVGTLTEPMHVVFTGCRGLTAFETSADQIFMGFMMSMTEFSLVVQAYDYLYQRQAHIVVPINGNMFADLALCLDGKFLLGGHNEGLFSVIRLEDQNVQVVEQPFGYVDSVWDIEPYSLYVEGEPHTIFVPTTNGMF